MDKLIAHSEDLHGKINNVLKYKLKNLLDFAEKIIDKEKKWNLIRWFFV